MFILMFGSMVCAFYALFTRRWIEVPLYAAISMVFYWVGFWMTRRR
jgi:hypothetical protein